MKERTKNIAYFVVKKRVVFISLFIILTLFFAYRLRYLSFQTSLSDFIPKEHPFVKVQDKLTQAFGGLNQVSLAIEVKNGTILNRETLGKVIRISEALYLMDGINANRLTSLSARKIKMVTADEEGFKTERVLRDVPQTEAQMARLKEKIRRNPNVFIRMVSEDFQATLIQADFEPGLSSREIFQNLRALVEKEKDANHNFYLAGRPILEGWLDFYLPKMFAMFALTFFTVAVILYLTFRSKRGVILPLANSSMATIWGLGILQLLGFRLDPSTALVPFLIFSLGISHSVQAMKRYYEEMRDENKKSKTAAQNTITSLFVSGLASVVTDGFGFLSLVLIPIPTIRSMALAGGCGIMSNFLTAFIFMPCVLSYQKRPKILEVRKEERHSLVDKMLTRLVYLFTHPKIRFLVLGIFLILAILGITGLGKIVVGDNSAGSSYLYENSPYNQAEKFINEKFGGTNTYYIYVAGEGEDALSQVRALKAIESLQGYLRKEVPEAGYAISVVDYIKGLHMTMFAGKREYFRLPEQDRTVCEYLFLYSITNFPGDFNPVVTPDFSTANIKLDLKDHKSSTIEKILAKTKDWVMQNGKNYQLKFLYAGGDLGILAAINDTIKQSIPSNILFTAFLILAYVGLAYFSLTLALLLLLPLLFSLLMIFAIFGFSHLTLNLSTLPLAALSMGLGVDYGIYLIGRLEQEIKEKGAHLEKALHVALLTTGKASFFSGIIVCCGILVWAFSEIRLQASLGITLSLCLLFNLLGALILLPVLISLAKPSIGK
jgi:predicted RND superfamily exporter protein